MIADAGAYVCLMHMQGEPRTMQVAPRYDDVVAEVAGFLEERLAVAVAAGIPEEHVCLDPGIGFGKTPDQNLGAHPWPRADLPDRAAPCSSGSRARARWHGCSATRPATVGTDAASVGAAVAAFDRGASIFRAHDVAAHVEALAAAAAVERGSVAMTIELHGIVLHGFHGVLERGASRRPALPRRRRARPRARAGCAHRSDRGRGRLPRGRGSRQADLGRARLPPARGLRGRDCRRAVAELPVTVVRVRVRKPDVVLDPPVVYAAVTVERRTA